MDIVIPILFKLHCVLGPSGVLPHLGLIESLADHAGIDIWSMVPSLVDELGENPDVLAKFAPSKFICASGGPVSPIIVSKVNEVVRVLNLTGTTEGLFSGNLWTKREDWHWFAFHPYSGFEFREIQPGVFEHWIHRNKHWQLFQGIFHTFPDQDSVNLKDLYIKHPDKPNLWAFSGRSDDVVVLSNGYKISPLDTEALVTTHPAIDGCLLIGAGKPQAGLLIELKEPSAKNNDLFDSIWATVERANNATFQTSRLQRQYIAFEEADKPFIRTDKRTIKRRATLNLYADFIDRFYESREEDGNGEDMANFNVDTNSVETIATSIAHFVSSIVPDLGLPPLEEDVFDLGLDSLLVVRLVKIVRAATGLQEQLAPRHLYGNSTITAFAVQIADLLENTKLADARQNGPAEAAFESETACSPCGISAEGLQSAIAQHKRRVGCKMNPFDAVNPNHYMGLNMYFPLQPGITFAHAFVQLQRGLVLAFTIIPELDGRMTHASHHEFGYRKGENRLLIPPLSSTRPTQPRQLVSKDLSRVLPSFNDMRDANLAPSLFSDQLVLECDPFPQMPADILVAQANFVEGGCILAVNFIHTCLDGVGMMVALRVWAECCRFLEGDETATCRWFDPESFNHSLPEILYQQAGFAKPTHEVDPGTWGFLPFFRPEDFPDKPQLDSQSNPRNRANGSPKVNGTFKVFGLFEVNRLEPLQRKLPPPPVYPHQPVWPAPPAERSLGTTVFLITREQLANLKRDALTHSEAKQQNTSISDVVQALFWRASIKSRYRVATKIRGQPFRRDEVSILEMPVDGRPHFSAMLPSSYMGSMLIMNRTTMTIEDLCSSATSIGQIACLIREAAARITP